MFIIRSVGASLASIAILSVITDLSRAEEAKGFMALVKKRQTAESSAPPVGGPRTHEPAEKKKDEARAPAKQVHAHSEEVEGAAPAVNNSKGQDNQEELILKQGQTACLVVSFESASGEVVACTKPLHIQYTRRECDSGKVIESGEAEAMISCPDPRRIELRFRSSQNAWLAVLRMQRESQGRAGVGSKYSVERFTEEQSSLADLLPAPELKPQSGLQPEESPIRFNYSGFAWVEFERSTRYGFDAGTTSTPAQVAQANFSSRVPEQSQSNQTFFTNFSLEVGKDRTSVVSLFEIGEIYFGDTASGGAQGGRASNIFEVRNLYLNQEFSTAITAQGGLITTASDPRAFIFNDQVTAIQGSYKTDLNEAQLWFGNAAQKRATATPLRDQYLGLSGTMGFLSGIKSTLYGVYRSKAGDSLAVGDGSGGWVAQAGDSHYYWLGATLKYEGLGPLVVEATGIGNRVSTRLPSQKDEYSAYLFDAKLTYAWEAPQIDFTLEGLITPGATGVTESSTGKQRSGKRRNFVSPVGATYLLTVMTSDGVDDAPGTPKQSTLANLNQEEGLRLLVFTSSVNVTKRMTLFGRYGRLMTSSPSSATSSKTLGDEVDLGAVYQLTPSATLQADYGHFMPGAFYSNRDTAALFATRLKFTF